MGLFDRFHNEVATLFHQPFGGTGGTTDAYGLYPLYPFHVNLIGGLYLMAVGIHAQTFLEQHLAIAALMAAHKKDKVVAGCKACNVRHAVGYLTADGVETLEGCLG